jgi:hypothetical protein
MFYFALGSRRVNALSDTDADSEAIDLALYLIKKKKMPLDQRMVHTHITIHTRKFHDRLKTEGAKRQKSLLAIRRPII